MPANLTNPPSDLSDAIRVNCERALRRLDVLAGERNDPVLHQARRFVQHALVLALEQSRVSGRA